MTDRNAADEAARWFLRLQDASARAETFLEWQRWLDAAPGHRRAYEEMEATILRMRQAPSLPLPTTEEMVADVYDGSVSIQEFLDEPAALPPHAASTAKHFQVALAAGFATICVLGGWLWLATTRESSYGALTYSTAAAERRTFTLADGSKITLDADSVLNADLQANERLLRLDRGEAYFEVAKNPARPFIVHAGGARVRAVGTAFNVRMGADRTVVAVTEGAVEMTSRRPAPSERSAVESSEGLPGTKPGAAAHEGAGTASVQFFAQLRAGEAAVAYGDDGKLNVLPAQTASAATSWLEGRRQYRDEPLRYVLADVDRYTERRIELGDVEVGDLEFTGTLNLKNSDTWLKGLSIALPVTITEREDGTLLVRFHGQPESAAL